MKQEDQNKPISFWKFLIKAHYYVLIPLILGRILAMSGSFGFMGEKDEYSLGLFLAGITPLWMWLKLRWALPEDDYKKIWGYNAIFLVLTIYFWVRAIASFLELL